MKWSDIAPAKLQLLEHKGVEAAVLIGTVLILNFLLRLILRLVQKKNQKRRSFSWVRVFIEAVDRPLRVYLWVVVAAYSFYWIFEISFQHDFLYFLQGELIATLAIIVWALMRLVLNIEGFYLDQVPKRSRTASMEISGIKAVSRLVQVGVLMLTALMVLAIVNVPLSGLVTFGGVSGIAVAYAGKGVLTNFFGGMMIFLNRQFAVGDLIASPDRNIEGTVERIDWRYTTIRANNKQVLYVPNGVFIDIIVINRSRMSHRRLDQTIGVSYDDVRKIPLIFQEIRDFLNHYEEIDPEPGIFVHLSEFTASSVNFLITVYTVTTISDKSLDVQDTILLKAYEIIKKAEAGFSSPTTLLLTRNSVAATPQK